MLTAEEKAEVEDLIAMKLRLHEEPNSGIHGFPTIQADNGNITYHCPECDKKIELLAGSIGECPQCQTQL